MRKWLVLLLVLLGVVMMGCDAKETAEEIAFHAKVSYAGWTEAEGIYIGALNREKMYESKILHLPIFKFESLEEMERFGNAVGDKLSIDIGYEEAFFEENTVLLVYVGANSGSYRYDVSSVVRYEDVLCVHVEQTNEPEEATDDMAGWFVMVGVAKDDIAGCTEFDADLNNSP